MRSLELFTGAGGLAKGMEMSGFQHLALVESNKNACLTLRKNFTSDLVFEEDIRDFDFSKISNIDVVAGGPPCQPFSLGGKHLASDDSRDMFPYAIQAINKTQPKAFVFENVKGLLRPSFCEYFEYIIKRLSYPHFIFTNQGDWRDRLFALRNFKHDKNTAQIYNVYYKLLNAADYGVPQMRERVVIVGIRADLDITWNFPKPTHSENRLLWEQFISGEYWERHGVSNKNRPELNDISLNKVVKLGKFYKLFPPEGLAWQTIKDALLGVPDPREVKSISDHVFKDGARSYHGHTGSEIDWPSKTIKAGGHGVPGGENMIRFRDNTIRYLTVYEAKLLQTFPKNFRIAGAWGEAMRQIGNAVPVVLSKIICSHLYNLLSEKVNSSSLEIKNEFSSNLYQHMPSHPHEICLRQHQVP